MRQQGWTGPRDGPDVVYVQSINERVRGWDMARRDRFSNLIWLARLPGDDDPLRMVAGPEVVQPISDSIYDLTHSLDLWVEMELIDGLYHVRCYPRRRTEANMGTRPCVSYKGERLSAVLHVAVDEYSRYLLDPVAAQLSRTEACRWIA